MLKKYISMCLFLLLLLSATALANEVSPLGRYVESEFQAPDRSEWISQLFLSEDGRLTVLSHEDKHIVPYVMDGRSWVKSGIALNISEFSDIAQSGDISYVLFYEHDANGEYSGLGIGRFVDGEMVPMDLDIDKIMAHKLGAAADGTLLVQLYKDCILAFDPETQELLHRFDGLDGAFTVAGGELFAVSSVSRSVKQYDIATGELIAEMTYAPLTGEDLLAFDGEAVYLANRGGIYRIAPGGTIWERLVDGNLTSLCLPSFKYEKMAVQDGDVYMTAYNDQGQKLLRYRYDATVSTLPKYELRVYTLRENATLTHAASLFQNQNPDYLVNITVLLSEGTAATSDDVIRALNTELLAGMGPDVLLLDGMPMRDYIEKGILLDLGQLVDGMKNDGELISSLFTPFYQGEKIFAVPTSCELFTMMGKNGNLTDVRTLNDLISMLDGSDADGPIPWRTRQGYFNMFLPASYPAWFTADGQLDEQVFQRYLEAVDSIFERTGIANIVDDSNKSEDRMSYLRVISLMSGGGSELLDGNDDVRTLHILDLLRAADGRSMLFPFKMGSFGRDMIETTALTDMEGALAWLPGQAGCAYEPMGILGVNARSERVEAAVDLVRLALSKEVQEVDAFGGLPVNPKALAAHIEKEDSFRTYGTSFIDPDTGVETELTGMWPERTVRERIGEMLNEAKTPYIPDSTLIGMIKAELTPYFAGEMDAQTATRAVSAKVRAYLAE